MNIHKKAFVFVGILFSGLFFSGMSLAGEPRSFQSGSAQTPLIELFTSEGCSSCPPADAWMSGLRSSPGLWKKFVPVAYHVDYWDYLGWKDGLSSAEFSARQRNYAARRQARSVYTPMLVNNGQESRDWRVESLLDTAGRKDAGVLKVASAGDGNFEVTFLPTTDVTARPLSVNAAYLGCDLLTRVGAGENEGKILRHDFAALSFLKKDLVLQGGILKAAIHFDLKKLTASPHHAIAVWVTPSDSEEPLQATGGYLD